jgi:hypothetical protein
MARSGFQPIRFAACAVLLAALAACSAAPQRIAGPTFPTSLARGETLDVQVRRDTTHIALTNTSERTLPAGRLWLNMRFSAPVAPLAPGDSLSLDLRTFRDDLGDTFRAGGFFSSQRPDPVVLAQWEGDNQLLGLIAIAPEAR